MEIPLYILLIAVFLGLNALFNGAETGLVAIDPDYLRFKVRSDPSAWREKKLLKIVRVPENYLSVTLLGINSCLVVATSLLTVLLQKAGPLALQLGTLVDSIFIFLACEFIPKMLFSERPLKLCLKFLPALIIAEIIFYIPVRVVTFFTRVVMSILKIPTDKTEGRLSREELLILLMNGSLCGTLEKTSSEMARGIIELRDTTVKEIMIPRPQIVALELNTSVDVAMKTVIQSGFSRIPVYRGEIDQIVGILYFKDLFMKSEKIRSLSEIMLPPLFVPEMKPALGLFREMREKSAQVAVVVDEFASVAGIVTFEDLVEEVVGEIHDEFDKPKNRMKFNDDGTILVRGDVNLFELNHIPEFEFSSVEGVTTINGLIQENLGRIPAAGETFMLDGFRLKIISGDERKVDWIKIIRETPGK